MSSSALSALTTTLLLIDVGAGGAGGAGNQWRDQDILTKLAGLQGMVDSLTGFAGEEATLTAAGGGGGGDQDLHYNASNISAAHRPSQSTPFGRHHHHQQQQEQGQPRLPPICPILISQNGFFASEIMGGRGGGGDWRGAGGRNRSLVMNAYPVQVRFQPYTKVECSP
ncbi:unnamed protein product [Ectocarpus sp. CCAP 1310/34]|nr:unnamed protein product [Ectocarpus sp. CCAP 1310/34]